MPNDAIEAIKAILICLTVVSVTFILTYGCVEVSRLNNETERAIGYPGQAVSKP